MRHLLAEMSPHLGVVRESRALPVRLPLQTTISFIQVKKYIIHLIECNGHVFHNASQTYWKFSPHPLPLPSGWGGVESIIMYEELRFKFAMVKVEEQEKDSRVSSFFSRIIVL